MRAIAATLLALATFATAAPAVVPPTLQARQTDPDFASCESFQNLCNLDTVSNPKDAFTTAPCFALALCLGVYDFGITFGGPQQRLSESVVNQIGGNTGSITQQQWIDYYYGTISSMNATGAKYPPTYPESAQYVINIWQAVAAWTGFCSTSTIPYKNLADYLQYVDTPGVCGAVSSCDAGTAASAPACVPQPSTDNGSCGQVYNECLIFAGNAHNVFANSYCVLAAFCYYESTVDVMIEQLTKADYLYTGKPLLSIDQPRLTQDVFNLLSKNGTTVSQQNVIDAYYSALTDVLVSAGGPPGAETPRPSGNNGPYPTSSSYVIGFWDKIAAWTGFCSTKNIPYQNLADYLQYSSTIAGPATSCS